MADRFVASGLQLLAYSQIIEAFSPSQPTIPSREFLRSLFSEESPLVIQMHVVGHVAFWLPKSKNKEDWAELFTVHDRFGTEMALAMIRSQYTALGFLHPSNRIDFAEDYGFNLSELETQARAADGEPFSPSSGKCLGKATLSKCLATSLSMNSADCDSAQKEEEKIQKSLGLRPQPHTLDLTGVPKSKTWLPSLSSNPPHCPTSTASPSHFSIAHATSTRSFSLWSP